jgi:ATP-dependent Lon protease
MELGIDPDVFERIDIHLHVPAGAIPKDGPSAGVAMVVAMASVLSGHPARHDVGMTGEITLRGRVLPVGGVKMKVLAAHRAGLSSVIIPKQNERDLDELPEDIRDALTFIPVDLIGEALQAVLQSSVDTPYAVRVVGAS